MNRYDKIIFALAATALGLPWAMVGIGKLLMAL